MPRVIVQLPRVLARLLGDERAQPTQGATVGDALHNLVNSRPGLALHLFDDTGEVRRHVLCCLNDEGARGHASLDRRLEEGDVITLVNSLAGG